MKNLIYIFLLLTSTNSFAQYSRFVTQGKIEFEKRVNMHAIAKKQAKIWGEDGFTAQFLEKYLKENPQFKTFKSQLYFNNDITAFIPEEDLTVSGGWFSNLQETKQINSILSDLKQGTTKTQKKVYEASYLITDSLKKINWKITEEFKNIAGYNCRRANAIVQDSIYVVAFYADEIAVSSGPETFNGLPGMILGVALPHDNVTWFATSVTDETVNADKLKIPTKGKQVNRAQFNEVIKGALKDWGKYAHTILKWILM